MQINKITINRFKSRANLNQKSQQKQQNCSTRSNSVSIHLTCSIFKRTDNMLCTWNNLTVAITIRDRNRPLLIQKKLENYIGKKNTKTTRPRLCTSNVTMNVTRKNSSAPGRTPMRSCLRSPLPCVRPSDQDTLRWPAPALRDPTAEQQVCCTEFVQEIN